MGDSPNRQDYQPTESDKALARQSLKDFDKAHELYFPKLEELKAQAASGDVARTLRGRANADTMQKGTAPSYLAANKTDNAGLLGSALSGQLGDASARGEKFQNDMETSILATRQGQSGVASQGLSALAKMDTNARLQNLQNKQLVDQARSNMTGKLVMAGVNYGAEKGLFGGADSKSNEFFQNFSSNLAAQNNRGYG
tara:strand:- start:45 stop:638 length:594 start_codon:yes stop_codon:yes gene_type:complete